MKMIFPEQLTSCSVDHSLSLLSGLSHLYCRNLPLSN